MKTISTEKIPIKLWLDDIEDGALQQAKNLANLPFAFKWIALMPDAHHGYGMPIGGVLATKDVVVPNAVGVDIGCGMCAIKSSLKNIETEILKKIMGEIRNAIPVGFKKHSTKQDKSYMPAISEQDFEKFHIIPQEFSNALKSIGTLGGGNHFIEIQKGSDGFIWIMIHSGSRNIGFKVANYYNKLAMELNKKWYSSVPKEWELSFLPVDTIECQNYIGEMNYCVAFALKNRELMLERTKEIFISFMNSVTFGDKINIAHNYVDLESHYGQNVWVHRKGATLARKETIGIIPGSQGSKSYIVQGKGSAESFNSCSHGAGRLMGRKQAQRKLNLKEEQKKLEDLGVIHSVRHASDLDEAPGSYKPISIVMENQKDLVDIKVELTPLAVIKG